MNFLMLQLASDQSIQDPLLKQVYKDQQLHHQQHYGINHKDFLELPRWMAEVKAQLNWDDKIDIEIKKSTRIMSPRHYYYDYHLASIMDSNKEYWYDMISGTTNRNFIIGGYGDLSDFKKLYNCQVINKPSDIRPLLGYKPIITDDVDYSIFKGYNTIPRLQMSTGCTNNCKFCTVPNKVKKISSRNIIKQINEFERNLEFTYMYIDDKTFGQCPNFIRLEQIYSILKRNNPKFEGFVVQTTCTQFIKSFTQFEKMHIKYVELGIETYNLDILTKYNKADTIYQHNMAMILTQQSDIKLIPNIMVGLPEETIYSYTKTLTFLKKNIDQIAFINVFPYCKYSHSGQDANENSIARSFHTTKQREHMLWMIKELNKLNEKLLKE